MTVLIALVVALLFAAGVELMARRDAIVLSAGTLLVSNSVVLLLVLAGWRSAKAPILPVAGASPVADPLVQALALTAIVIGFGTSVLVLRIVLALERTHDSIDLEEITREAETPEDEAGSER